MTGQPSPPPAKYSIFSCGLDLFEDSVVALALDYTTTHRSSDVALESLAVVS